MRRSMYLIRRYFLLAGALALASVLAAPAAQADTLTDVLACERIDFDSCAALLQAEAEKTKLEQGLVAVLVDASQPAARRVKVAQVLAAIDVRSASEVLISSAQTLQGKPERVDLLQAAARLGNAKVAPQLLDIVEHDGDVRACTLAAGALGILHEKKAVAALIRLVGRDDAPRLQAEAAHALGMLGDPQAIAPLLALASRPQVYVPARVQAVDALAALHSAQAVVLATQLVDAPTRDIGRAALRVLQAVPTAWTEPAVRFALETPGLRGEAARAVQAMQLSGCGALLLQAMAAPDLDVQERPWVLHAIGKLQTPGAGPALLKQLQVATAEPEKILLLHAMPEVGDKTVVPELVLILQTAQKPLNNHIIFALENLTGQRLGPDVVAWRKLAGLDKP